MINTDSFPSEDILARDKFAKEFAERLIRNYPNGSDGLTIAVTGKWGIGKTTLLQYIKKYLEELQSTISDEEKMDQVIIDFNPWMYNGQKELQTIFLSEIAAKAGNTNEYIKVFFKNLSERTLLPKLISSIGLEVTGVKVSLNNLEKLLDSPLDKLKEQVNNELVEKKRRLFVFIDDIDRLEPQSIAEIMQLTRLNASLKNTIYILAYDKGYVEGAISKHYGINGEQYLEKIVQIDYSIPEISTDKLKQVFFKQLDIFCKQHNISVSMPLTESIWDVYELKSFFLTLRNVYHYFNSLNFRLPTIHTEIEVEDFLIIEAFRIFRPSVFNDIVSSLSISPYQKRFGSFVNKYLEDNNEDSVVRNLFGVLKNNNIYDRYGKKGIRKRLLDPKYIERYFTLDISNNDISTSELDSFINIPESRKDTLERLKNFDRIKDLFVNLGRTELRENYKLTDPQIFWDILVFAGNNPSIYSAISLEITDSLFNLCLLFEDRNKAMGQLVGLLTQKVTGFSISIFYTLWFFKNENYKKGKYYALLNGVFGKFSSKISEGYLRFLEQHKAVQVLPLSSQQYGSKGILFLKEYAKYFPEEYLHILENELLTDEQNLLSLLQAFASFSGAEVEPISVETELESILMPALLKPRFLSRLRAIDLSTLPPKSKMAVKEYIDSNNK